jgi:hypothetical protein
MHSSRYSNTLFSDPPPFSAPPSHSAANGSAAMDVDAAEEAVESEFDQIDAVRACSAETRTSSHPVLTKKHAHILISLAFVQSLLTHSHSIPR